MNVVVYVQKRVPHQALDSKTPEEVFTSVKLDVGHLHIFGCPVYFHVSKDKRNKMEAMGRKNVALGKARDLPLPPSKKKNGDMDIWMVLLCLNLREMLLMIPWNPWIP